ncbi:MAG: tetratricopeptide repeat protein [Puniceicoccaceae bacterium]
MKPKTIMTTLPIVAALAWCLYSGSFALFRPDQVGMRMYTRGDYNSAAVAFSDPQWKGAALYRDGAFKDAGAIFAGQDTAESAFNRGNSLVMQGQYEEAVRRYDRALELRPGWEDATVNRDIARARAELLQREGGEMTGGMLGADEIVFTEGSSSPSSGEEVVEESMQMTDSELQALWLRQVQTKPADFLRAKFAYQFARGDEGGQE